MIPLKNKFFLGVVVTVMMLFFPSSASADLTFSRTYSGSDASGVQAVSAQNGYYISCIDRQNSYFGIMWLIRTDAEGNILWSRPFYESNTSSRDFESGGYILPTTDGGCLISGHSEPRATGSDTDVCLVKVDSTGVIVWEQVFGENDDNVYCTPGLAGSTSGYLLAFSHMYTDAFFVMYDQAGNMLWQSEFLNEGYYIEALSADNDDGFLAIVKDRYGQENWILGIDNTGQLEYIKLPESTQIQHTASVDATEDGGHLICGRTEDSDAFLTRMDHRGNPLWNYTSQFQGTDRATCVEVTADGMIALAGLEKSGDDEYSGWLALLDHTGELQWKRNYTFAGFSVIESVRHIPGGGFILCGTTTLEGTGSAWFLRTDESGHVTGSEAGYPEINENTVVFREPLGWIFSCEVLPDSASAEHQATELQQVMDIETGILWIPDWPSLSGYEGWLVYAGPYYWLEDPDLQRATEDLLKLYPDAYLIFAGSEFERNTLPLPQPDLD
ncbi:MAG: hypothetical protein KAH31_10580 [Candidatus Sabulitectum sp.]|nr:hypothetical protein [Candidatus Sabulitectum sp.]